MRDPDLTHATKRSEGAPVPPTPVPSPDEITQYLGELLSNWGAGEAAELRELVRPEARRLDEPRVVELMDRIAHCGEGWGYHPPDPFVRWLSREIMGRVVTGGTLLNGSVLALARQRSVVFLGNHLSFIDANVFDFRCAAAGHAEVVDQMTTIVGPKVYSQLIRKLASLCFGTVKIAQSQSIASDEAVMSPREVARVVRENLAVAHERVAGGDHLLIFPEGSRSRTASMQRLLPAVSRYLTPDVAVVPFGLAGTQDLDPIDADHVHPSPVDVFVGEPIEASDLLALCGEKRGLVMDAMGFLIAATLPSGYRGIYGEPDPDTTDAALERAREIAAKLAS